MLTALDGHRQRVSRHFEDVFGDPSEAQHALDELWLQAQDQERSSTTLRQLGYTAPEAIAQRLAMIHAGARYAQLPQKIRCRFDALVPRIISAACNTEHADLALTRTLDLLEMVSRRGAYLALLQQYPRALQRVVEVVSASSWAAHYLNRHPILMDELLDDRNLSESPDWRQFSAEMAAALDAAEPDTERQMDLMREQHHIQVFRLLTLDLAGALSVEALSDHLTALADILLAQTLAVCWRKLPSAHRPEPRFAVISYGKLGGKELGYASDLDLVFLYDDDAPEAPERYARLGQRMTTWLSSRTAAGMLFETDMRLRPNGESGLLVSSLEAFHKYQLASAWVWEHQALTRARYSAGDQSIGERFEAIRREVLCQQRDPDALREEVLKMRQKMMDAHGNKGGELFDIKHGRGGLVDVEFLVQYLVLAHAHRHPQLSGNLGNIALLHMAGDLGLIDARRAKRSADAYRSLRRMQHRQRLNELAARVAPASARHERTAVEALWGEVFGS
jgi:glutamate-ammonia-ligase adenylyltransferase